ncbi:MAG: helix-turn-helix transcriptional regulator [Pseudomonadota bacterium]
MPEVVAQTLADFTRRWGLTPDAVGGPSPRAEAAGLLESHFRAAFRKATGWSPSEFVLTRRIARAKTALSGSDRSLPEIALACGLADQSHLTRRFREATGVTPAAYRWELSL